MLYRHPQVMEAAVVARSDEKWGEHPCAFVTLKPEQRAGHAGGHHRLLPRQHGALQGAAHGRVRAAAQDLDRQDPEIRPARPGQAIALRRPTRLGQINRNRTYPRGSECVILLALWSARKSNVDARGRHKPGVVQGRAYGLKSVRPGTMVIGSVKRFPARQRGVRAAAAALGA